jgi:hypothetical protein
MSPWLTWSHFLNYEFEGARFRLRSFGDTSIPELRELLDRFIGEPCSKDKFDIAMPDETVIDDEMTLDDVGPVDFLKIVRKKPPSPIRRIQSQRVVSSPPHLPPHVLLLNNGTEKPITCAVTPESTLREIESIVRTECRLENSPIEFLIRMRSNQEISPVSVFPREKFGEFDLVICTKESWMWFAVREWRARCVLNSESTLDLSHLSESNQLRNLAFDFDRYRQRERIGKGVQGEVYLYQHATSGELIAVKILQLNDGDIRDGNVEGKILREVQSLMRFRHPCIVPLLGYDFQIESKFMRIAMSYVGPDSLESVLKSPENHPWLSFTLKTKIIVGIVIGMYLVHSGGIIHRDLKPGNILLDPTSHCPIIGDFGLSREEDASVTMTHEQGTPLYMAPELLDDEHYCYRYSNKVDIFSFGILLYEIVTGQKPLQDCGCSHFKLFNKIRDGSRASIPDTVEAFTANLISRCWDADPDRRPTFLKVFYELRDHRFKIFSAVDSQAVEEFLHSLL